MNNITGNIFNIQKFSIHDGPGIRTTVFVKGCPLSCKWCHNPESIASEPVLAFYTFRCKGCGRCERVCPQGCIDIARGVFDRSRCTACGECVSVCAAGAREIFGYETTVEKTLETVMQDEIFYKTSGGGMTISGGEPFCQPEFTLALLAAAKEKGLHTAVETNCLASVRYYEEAMAVTDLFFIDIKFMDEARHRQYCGAGCRVILDNIRFLSEKGADIIFRTPVIPGINDGEIPNIAEFNGALPRRHRLELLKYHKIGAGKYEALGMPYELQDIEPKDLDCYDGLLAELNG